MSNVNQYFGLGISKKALMEMCSDCSVCLIAKQRKVNITDPVRRSRLTPAVESSAVSDSLPPLLVLDEVSADLMGPMSFFDGEQLKLPSISGNNYVLVLRFFNRASGMKFIMVRTLKTKEASEVVPLFISLIEYMEKQTNCHLLNFHSDGGGQYYAKTFLELTSKHKFNNSMCEYAWENGKAERVNGVIKNNYLIHRNIKTLEDLVKEVDRSVSLYNSEKPHIKLKRKPPITFEKELLCLKKQTKPMMKESFDAI